ncbi:uncharacterized protein LOC132205068 [Neocloeon triangulifer]|uniref:uncharacterized protein LOC132205068 n=1 Tax=Neocloeon triangulifer TaxID=2078957 RepID=UPI00286F9E6A|nr:uncharacterized protein LOC132205068 [Neocloeon triangulifer]
MARFITLCIAAAMALQVVWGHHEGEDAGQCFNQQCLLLTTIKQLATHAELLPLDTPLILPIITKGANGYAVSKKGENFLAASVQPEVAAVHSAQVPINKQAEEATRQQDLLVSKLPAGKLASTLSEAVATQVAAAKATVPQNLGAADIHEVARQQELLSQVKASIPQVSLPVNLPKVQAAVPNADAVTSKVNSALPLAGTVPNAQAAVPVQLSKLNVHEVIRQLGLLSNGPLNTPVSLAKVQAAVPNVGAVASKVTSALPVEVPNVLAAVPAVSTVTGALPLNAKLNTGALSNLPIVGSLGLRCNSCKKK